MQFDVTIEILKGSRNKYAFDFKIDAYKLKVVLPHGTIFPFDFGSIPGTIADVSDTESTCDFELPGSGKINAGFDVVGNDVPGWKNAGPNQNDSGIDTAGHTGSYCAYVQKGQSGAYQITTNVMQQGSSITMTWWERNEWQNLTAKVSLLSASSQAAAFGSTTVLVSQTNALGNGNTDFNWHQRTITYTAGAGDAGKLLGVGDEAFFDRFVHRELLRARSVDCGVKGI